MREGCSPPPFFQGLSAWGILKVFPEDRVRFFTVALLSGESKLYYRELKRKFVNNPWKKVFKGLGEIKLTFFPSWIMVSLEK